jgi:hypothetical protein
MRLLNLGMNFAGSVKMALSNKTTTVIASIRVREDEDLYPDRSATTGEIRVNASTVMRLVDVPRTTEDMSEMFQWKPGDKIYGTVAKNSVWGKQYRRDINRAIGKEYKAFYVDPLKPVKKQLEKR